MYTELSIEGFSGSKTAKKSVRILSDSNLNFRRGEQLEVEGVRGGLGALPGAWTAHDDLVRGWEILLPVADALQQHVGRVEAEVLLDLLEEGGEEVDAGLGASEWDPMVLDGHDGDPPCSPLPIRGLKKAQYTVVKAATVKATSQQIELTTINVKLRICNSEM